MSWQTQLRGDSVSWLLETENSGVRYLALRDLMGFSDEDALLKSARKKAHREGPIAEVLSHMKRRDFGSSQGRDIPKSIDRQFGQSSCWPSSAR